MNSEKSKDWWRLQKFGKLRISEPQDLDVESSIKKMFVCECGKRKEIIVSDVTSGRVSSCNQCDVMPAHWWYTKKFGKLFLKTSEELHSGSLLKREFSCDCGNEKVFTVNDVVSGRISCCGECEKEAVSLDDKVSYPDTPCGEVSRFLSSHSYAIELGYELSGHKYGVFVKDSKVLIEFNADGPQQLDEKKKQLIEAYGFKLILIPEKEWGKNKQKVLDSLLEVVSTERRIDHNYRTRSELIARLDEINSVLSSGGLSAELRQSLEKKRSSYIHEMRYAHEDVWSAAITSHHVMCEVKGMKPEGAHGNDPFLYYGMGLAGESGELVGALLRAIRDGGTFESKKAAVESEIADCVIYAFILAYTTGIDIIRLVNEKARIVETRARSGYYGKLSHRSGVELDPSSPSTVWIGESGRSPV